jgi:phage tail P2-like protein
MSTVIISDITDLGATLVIPDDALVSETDEGVEFTLDSTVVGESGDTPYDWQALLLWARADPDHAHLLPINATDLERATSRNNGRVDEIETTIGRVFNPATIPAAMLPWLAWGLSVDLWFSEWTEAEQRAVCADSLLFHFRKGTPGSLLEMLNLYDLGEGCSIVEWPTANGVFLADGLHPFTGEEPTACNTHMAYADGAWRANGVRNANNKNPWAMYSLRVASALSNAKALLMRRVLKYVAPLRNHLVFMDFSDHALLADGTLDADGAYNAGVAHGQFI